MRWEQREWRVARLLTAMALVRLSDSGLLDLDLLRTRPSYRAVLLHDLVALPCMAAAEMEGEEDEAAHLLACAHGNKFGENQGTLSPQAAAAAEAASVARISSGIAGHPTHFYS